MKRKFQNRKGFTIIELTIVMIVIAAILSAVLFSGQSVANTSKITSALSSIKALQTAAVNYFNNNGGSYANISIANLAAGNYLPANFTSGAGTNPWSGDIDVAPDTNAAYFDVAFTNVPAAASNLLTTAVTKLAQTAPVYTAKTSTWTAAF